MICAEMRQNGVGIGIPTRNERNAAVLIVQIQLLTDVFIKIRRIAVLSEVSEHVFLCLNKMLVNFFCRVKVKKQGVGDFVSGFRH
jgi:hypothetical protein